MIAWAGAASIGQTVLRAWWAVPVAIGLHAMQLLVSALAWRLLSADRGVSDRRALGLWWRIRWVREAVNAMLPVAQIGGNVAGIRLLAQSGLPVVRAAAATILDLTAEAASQAAFTLAGIALLAATMGDRHWLPWFGAGLLLLCGGVAGFAAAQRLGLLRLVERFAARAGLGLLTGLHETTMRLARPRSLALAFALHLAAWLIGTGETVAALGAVGASPGLIAASVIECLGMAARSAGFAVPGALGVQETGFVLVCGLYGIPADTAVALSLVKRARELIVGVGGLLAWQWVGATPGGVARSESDPRPE